MILRLTELTLKGRLALESMLKKKDNKRGKIIIHCDNPLIIETEIKDARLVLLKRIGAKIDVELIEIAARKKFLETYQLTYDDLLINVEA
jgi:hypothetical protein